MLFPTPDAPPYCGIVPDSERNNVAHFLNRMLGLVPKVQAWLFNWYLAHLDAVIANAKKEGRYDNGIVDIQATSLELQGEPRPVFVDELSGGRTLLFKVRVDKGIGWEQAVEMLREHRAANGDSGVL